MHLVVMGVSGSGKSTIGRTLAARTGRVFLEGDDLHPTVNVEKMRAGTPLEDEDRWPWLQLIARRLDAAEQRGDRTVLAASVLRRAYRDVLRLRDGLPARDLVFCHLEVEAEELGRRLRTRRGHFLPPTLLGSQLGVLEPLHPGERGVTVPVAPTVEETLERVVDALEATRGL